MITITKTERHYEPIDGNNFLVKLVDVKEAKKNVDHPEWEARLVFTVELIAPPFEKRRAWGRVPALWQEGGKLDRWLKALGVDQADDGCQLDVEQLKGQYALARIETEDGSTYPTVKDIKPLTQADVEKLNALVAKKAPTINVVVAATNVVPAPVVQPVVATPLVTSTVSTPVITAPAAPVVTAPVTPTPSAPRIRAIPF